MSGQDVERLSQAVSSSEFLAEFIEKTSPELGKEAFYEDVTLRIMQSDLRPDFLLTYFREPDNVQHLHWKHLDRHRNSSACLPKESRNMETPSSIITEKRIG